MCLHGESGCWQHVWAPTAWRGGMCGHRQRGWVVNTGVDEVTLTTSLETAKSRSCTQLRASWRARLEARAQA